MVIGGFPIVIWGFQWLFGVSSGYQGVSNGYWGFPMVIGGFQWLSGVSNGYRGVPMVIGGFSIVIGGFQWLSGVFNGFQWLSGVNSSSYSKLIPHMKVHVVISMLVNLHLFYI